jgi:MtfA peptidase
MNQHEFFSVAVENFFERPQALKSAMPELYTIVSKLLNQDPASGIM